MDFTFSSVKPGKYRVFLQYLDKLYGDTVSRSFTFKTPEAPPDISRAVHKPILTKRQVIAKKTVTYPTYNIKAIYKNTYGRVKITLTTAHSFAVGQKVTVDVTGITGHTLSDYQGYFDVVAPGVGISSIPSTTQFRYYKKNSIIAYGTWSATGTVRRYPPTETVDYVAATYLRASVPEELEKSLVWTKTVRDVVFFLYRNSAKKTTLKTQGFKYFDADSTDGTDVAFTTTPPTYPGLTKKRRSLESKIGTGYYEVRYLVARYECPSGDWSSPANITGYFPMIKATAKITNTNGFPSVSSINDIIVSASGVI